MATVTVEQVGMSYAGRAVLAGIDIAMGDGELVCLLGPSGCGKTTLLRVVAGFARPDRGVVRVGSRDVTALPPQARRMGMVFQAYSLFPNMTALDNVRFGPRVAGTAAPEQIARATGLLELVGLGEHAQKFPHQLSGGQQQRVALARALAVRPEVLLLDEPLSALDARVRVQLRGEIRRIQRETGITTILVTHDQEEALSMSDRVAVMSGGRLLQVASPTEIYREPADGFVARFIGAAAVLAGTARGGAVELAGLALPASAASSHASGSAVDLFVRPEHVRLSTDAANGVSGRVRETTFFGPLARLRLDLLDGAGGAVPGAELWADVPGEHSDRFAPGQTVGASWDPAAARVLARG